MNECGGCVSPRVSYLNEVEAQCYRYTCLYQRTGKQCERAVCFVGGFLVEILLGMTLSRVFGTRRATGIAKRLHLSMMIVRFSLDTVVRKVGDVVKS